MESNMLRYPQRVYKLVKDCLATFKVYSSFNRTAVIFVEYRARNLIISKRYTTADRVNRHIGAQTVIAFVNLTSLPCVRNLVR